MMSITLEWARSAVVRAIGPAVAALILISAPAELSAQAFPNATTSSPIALSLNEELLWVVVPDIDRVAVIRTDTHEVIARIRVGEEPQSVALLPNGAYAYVANAAGSTASVIEIVDDDPDSFDADEVAELTTGAEPWNIVTSPDGLRVFVANSGQDTITVIDASASGGAEVIGAVDLKKSLCNEPDLKRHFQPRGLAVSQDNTQLYVTQFLSFTSEDGVQGDDNGREGVVCRLDIDTGSSDIADYVPAQRLALASQITGFQFPGFAQDTSAFPNQLQSIVIRGDRAYLPNIAASPSAPLRFSLDTHAFLNFVDGVNSDEQTDGGALNLHLGAQDPEPGKKKLFFANIWAIAFTSQEGNGNAYVVAAGSDLLVKLNVDGAGNVSFTDDANTTRYIDLNDPENGATDGRDAGKNPRGIVANEAGTTAYVANFVSRNVSVVDLENDEVVDVIRTTGLPEPGSKEEEVLVGAEMFFSSRGHFDRPAGTDVSTDERLSSEGWQGCASCHFEGLTDGVVWVFGSGSRKSVPLNATFNPANPDEQRILNYSAIFDEVEDFSLNIRNVSGPVPAPGDPNDPDHGLLFDDGGDINLAPAVINAFALPNAGRNEFTVTLAGSDVAVEALTALREWVRLAIRTPNGPLDDTEVDGGVDSEDVERGRDLFEDAGCDECHGGSHWTTSLKDFISPPKAKKIFTETVPPPVFGNPVPNQYLDRFLVDIDSFNAGVAGEGNPIGNNIGAPELANAVPNADGELILPDGLGIDYNDDGAGDGFNVPSLLGIHNLQPYLHNGACETISCVLESEAHRTAGNADDVLDSQAKRNDVARFVESIDLDSEPID